MYIVTDTQQRYGAHLHCSTWPSEAYERQVLGINGTAGRLPDDQGANG